MELVELRSLIGTLIVGAYSILAIESVMYYLFSMPLTGFFVQPWGLRGQTHREKRPNGNADHSRTQEIHVAVFLGLALGLGILAEDISQRIVDYNPYPFQSIINAVSVLFPDKVADKIALDRVAPRYAARSAILIKPSGEPTALGRSLASSGAFNIACRADKLDALILSSLFLTKEGLIKAIPARDIDLCHRESNAPQVACETAALNACLSQVYYTAKNVTFEKETYYSELSSIQLRTDFTRSIAWLSYISLNLALALGVGVLISGRGRTGLHQGACAAIVLAIPVVFGTIEIAVDAWLHRRIAPESVERFLIQDSQVDVVYLVLYGLMGIVFCAGWLLIHERVKKKWNGVGNDAIRPGFGKKLVVLLIVFFSMHMMSVWSYTREVDEFNKRAYGYFETMLRLGTVHLETTSKTP